MEDDYEYSDNDDNQEDDLGTSNDKYPVDSNNDYDDDDDEEDEYEEEDDDDNDSKMEWRNSNENPNAAPMSFRGTFTLFCSQLLLRFLLRNRNNGSWTCFRYDCFYEIHLVANVFFAFF